MFCRCWLFDLFLNFLTCWGIFHGDWLLLFGHLVDWFWFVLWVIETFLLFDEKGLIFIGKRYLTVMTVVEILFLQKVDLFLELVVLFDEVLVHFHQFLVVVVNCLWRLLLLDIDPLTELYKDLRVVLYELSFLRLKNPNKLSHLFYDSVLMPE